MSSGLKTKACSTGRFSPQRSVGRLAPLSGFLSVEGTHKAGSGRPGLSWPRQSSGRGRGAPAPHTYLSRSRGPLAPPGSRLCTHHARSLPSPGSNAPPNSSVRSSTKVLRKIGVLLATLPGTPRLCPGAYLRGARDFQKSRQILTLVSPQRHHAFLRPAFHLLPLLPRTVRTCRTVLKPRDVVDLSSLPL